MRLSGATLGELSCAYLFKDAPFDPDRHEPLHARPPGGAVRVARTIFPGYLIGVQDRVFEKALVYLDRQ
jgi:hypothetical protein